MAGTWGHPECGLTAQVSCPAEELPPPQAAPESPEPGDSGTPSLERLWNVRQLDTLARACILLALMVPPSSAEHQDCCLLAYASLRRIWQVRPPLPTWPQLPRHHAPLPCPCQNSRSSRRPCSRNLGVPPLQTHLRLCPATPERSPKASASRAHLPNHQQPCRWASRAFFCAPILHGLLAAPLPHHLSPGPPGSSWWPCSRVPPVDSAPAGQRPLGGLLRRACPQPQGLCWAARPTLGGVGDARVWEGSLGLQTCQPQPTTHPVIP